MDLLELTKVSGFNGKIQNGLTVHPDGSHIIYPVGSVVVIENVSSDQQDLLQGHNNYITCLAVSRGEGGLIASGEITEMGLKASAIVWDYKSQEQKHKLVLHRGCVQDLAFSPNSLYLATLGGPDDGLVVLWSMTDGTAICSSAAQNNSAGNTLCAAFSRTSDSVFVTGGERTLRVWDVDIYGKRLFPTEVNIGLLKRTVQCIEVDDFSKLCFCGTLTGDIIVFNIETKIFQYRAPQNKLFETGVTALAQIKPGTVLVGTGCGNLHEFRLLSNGRKPRIMRSWHDPNIKSTSDAAITSIALFGKGRCFLGTRDSNVYRCKYTDSFDSIEQIKKCHSSSINGLVFPLESAKLFVTCQREQVRIWLTSNMKELVHFCIAKATCNAVDVSKDGNFIVSGWDDGVLRILIPATMRVAAEMKDAHCMGVTALACTWDNNGVVSGGLDGQVRVWKYTHGSRFDPIRLMAVMKEHRSSVTDIKINRNNDECVSTSEDGSCVIWDLIHHSRKQVLRAATFFKCVAYSGDETQIVTSGTDRKITYWEVSDGDLIRELDGSMTGTVNAIDVSAGGKYFVSGGDDRLLKLWSYDEGEVIKIGTRLTAGITCVKFSSDGKTIVSASEDGAILIWKPF